MPEISSAEETGIVRIGDRAPNFTANGFDARKDSFESYTLSSYRGKWVLLFFYPGDFTYVCPTELSVLARFKTEIDELRAKVFVISTDSKFSHKQWNECELSKAVDGGYPFPMLSDATGSIGSPYNIYDHQNGVELRGTVIINPHGVVLYIAVNTAELGRNPVEIIRCMKALQEHEASGRVMPACWLPGGETIDPSCENCGKMWEKHKQLLSPLQMK